MKPRVIYYRGSLARTFLKQYFSSVKKKKKKKRKKEKRERRKEGRNLKKSTFLLQI
jgi:hypothetical protein